MSLPLEQHQAEIQHNKSAWDSRPVLRAIYAEFYKRIIQEIELMIPGRIVELGSGMGNLKEYLPQALCTDLFPNPWLDLVCDAYELPFRTGTAGHLVLFDVFHHLERPAAFFKEAHRVLVQGGRIILFEPYISFASWPAYGIFHHEPVAWRRPIDLREERPSRRDYYAAQGNATRLFFQQQWLPPGWHARKKLAFATFAYLLSGGFSKPPLHPASFSLLLRRLDEALSRFPVVFGGRTLIVLERL